MNYLKKIRELALLQLLFMSFFLSSCVKSQVPKETLPAGQHNYSLTLAGVNREYTLYVSSKVPSSGNFPLVMVLHGLGSNPQLVMNVTGLNKKAEREGFVALYPAALGEPTYWNVGGFVGKIDDFAFLKGLIAHVKEKYNIDEKRVYIAGHSNGGIMAYWLAAAIPEQIAAVGVVSGAIGAQYKGFEIVPNKPGKPVPVVVFHGQEDLIVPYDGVHRRVSRYPFLIPVSEAIQFWLRANGCTNRAQSSQQGNVMVQRYTDCEENSEVALYTIAGGGHEWPAKNNLSATDEIWKFFQAHALKQGSV